MSRSLVGTVSGALFALALAVFALTVIEPAFRPITIGALLLGGVAALFLGWRARRVRHPTITRESVELEDKRPIEPK